MTTITRFEPRPQRTPSTLPPFDAEAEEAVIAALLIDACEVREEGVFRVLDGGDFFREANGWVYEAARSIVERDELVTPVTLAHELDRSHLNWEPAEGWLPMLVEITGKHFTAIGCIAHARIVVADSLYRRLIAAAGQIAQIAQSGAPGDTDRILSIAEDLIRNVRTGSENVIPAAHRFRGGFSVEGL